MIYKCAALIAAVAVIVIVKLSSHNKPITSSVWCFEGLKNAKLCKFRNICYDAELKTLFFFLNNESIIKGVESYKDLQKIQLSSVHHNKFYANITMVNINVFKNHIQYHKGFLFARFKPNNLMHTIHDDLFPVFLTLESVCLGDVECIREYNLILLDHYPKGPYYKLYELITNHPLVVLNEVNANVCFREMLVGMIQDGVFYQYGFDKPQGPVGDHLNPNDIPRFSAFVKDKLSIHKTSDVIIINRMNTRKIVNVDKLQEMVLTVYRKLNKSAQIKIIHLDKTADVIQLIQEVAEADVMIGMHGAEMILSIFMQRGTIFELFPYGISPAAVSFVRPIANSYFSWRNADKTRSVPHPDAHPLYGGIRHLDISTQKHIETTTEVQPVKCCNNPTYLYHMYQDTYVSPDFEEFMYKSMTQQPKQTTNMNDTWFFPSRVNNVNCTFHAQAKHVNITWQPPFNKRSDVCYVLYIQDKSGGFEKELTTHESSVLVEVPHGVDKFQVWVLAKCTINHTESPDVYIECG